jgi:hypothetical protein
VFSLGKKDKKIDFYSIVKDKKLPILTLDARWHEVFPEDHKTSEIKNLEQRVNNLLKKQGKLVNDIKDMKRLKNDLIKDIMANMEISKDPIGRAKEKKLEKNKQFINELNDKLTAAMDELAEIPYKVKVENEALLAESIHIFYDELDDNKLEIKEITAWIASIREELRNKILIKQDLEAKNTLMYSYMHDILGADLIEMFDSEQGTK